MAAKIPGNGIDANGQEIILDADGDTSITVSTDDQIDFKIAGADDFTVTANTFNIASGSKIAYGDGGSTSSLMGETWRYTASASLSGGDDQNIATNLERADDTATGHLNEGITHSSGIFTFPRTGIYWLYFQAYLYSANQGATTYIGTKIMTTVDNSSYICAVQAYQNAHANQAHVQPNVATIFDVTSTTNCKVKFNLNVAGNTTLIGSSTINNTYMQFVRLGDT